MLKSKRNTYSSAVKKQIVGHIKTLSSENPGVSLRRIVQIVRSHEGYEKVSHKMCSMWLRQFSSDDDCNPNQIKRGVKVNEKFESAVISRLFITRLTETSPDGKFVNVEIVARRKGLRRRRGG